MNSFIQANSKMFSRFSGNTCSNGVLLVEPQRHPIISHANAVFACIIKRAKGLRIVWIDNSDENITARLISYDDDSHVTPLSKLTFFDKMAAILAFLRTALYIIITRNIISIKLDGIRFGDILYDSYLADNKVATIHKINKCILMTLWNLIFQYHCFRKTIKDTNATAVLVSHQVGLTSGILFRIALAFGMDVYSRSGGSGAVECSRYSSLDDAYSYQRKPRKSDIDHLLKVEREIIEHDFSEYMNKRINSEEDMDARLAYGNNKIVYTSREDFAKKYGIDFKKKNIFIMLHAFNDHPHSHFGKMLFNDYFDWFISTLKYAKDLPDVNWIFKEHPSSKYYPTKDISLKEIFKNCPGNIIFLDADSLFNSHSLIYLADAVITVLGTAGVEFAAWHGIPSILTGRSFYDNFGFTVEPKSKDEYFKVLSNIQNMDKLTNDQQYIAKLVFLYIRKYSSVIFSWAPAVTFEETRSPDLGTYYWDRVTEQYNQNADNLINQFNYYSDVMGRNDFSRLLNLP